MLCGACAANSASLKYILSNKGSCSRKGQVCALLVGGASESLNALPGKYRIILKNRKGFVRIALETGTSLVPVFTFGEIDLFNVHETQKGSFARRIQDKVKELTNFGFPFCWGRGIFNYTIGLLPHRHPINTIVGEPIQVDKIEAPTAQDIQKLHDIYVAQLIKLFNEHKEKYLPNKDIQLEIE